MLRLWGGYYSAAPTVVADRAASTWVAALAVLAALAALAALTALTNLAAALAAERAASAVCQYRSLMRVLGEKRSV